jgi:hypothetical protein
MKKRFALTNYQTIQKQKMTWIIGKNDLCYGVVSKTGY